MKNRTQYISKNLAGFKLMDGANTGKIFFVEFLKKDGSVRRMTARRSVTKGVTGKGMAYRPLGKGLLTVFDMDKGAFRQVNLLKVVKFSVNGEKYLVV
jgi:hypothetical protein